MSAEVTSDGRVDPGTVQLHWNTTGSTGEFTTVPMTTTNGTRFEAPIPPQPVGTRISYYLSAGPPELPDRPSRQRAGGVACLRDHAPVDTDRERLAVELLYRGSGLWRACNGIERRIRARATYSLAGTNGWRTACIGWQGAGSVPATGAGGFLRLHADGRTPVITWLWQEQVALMHTSSPYGALGGTTWHATGALASSLFAPESHTSTTCRSRLPAGPSMARAGPAASAPSRRQIDGIPMPAPRLATATYVPTAQDSDANWIARLVRIALLRRRSGQDRYADPDDDGFENELEAADHTDPLD